jgi:hypothetical protein
MRLIDLLEHPVHDGQARRRSAALGYGDFEMVINVTAHAGRARAVPSGRTIYSRRCCDRLDRRQGMVFKMLPERPEFVSYTSRLAQLSALATA